MISRPNKAFISSKQLLIHREVTSPMRQANWPPSHRLRSPRALYRTLHSSSMASKRNSIMLNPFGTKKTVNSFNNLSNSGWASSRMLVDRCRRKAKGPSNKTKQATKWS